MSIKVMTLVWDRFPGSGSELLALLALADWCSDDGGSLYPSIATLAAKIRVSESQARRVLHGLIEKGFIEVVGNERGGAPGMTRDYRLIVSALRDLPVIEAEMGSTGRTGARGRTDARGSMDARDGSHGCAETGSTDATQTVSRTVIEPSEINKRARTAEGSPEFEQAWSLYPKRAGDNSKQKALKAWNARIAAGVESARMLDGVQRYAAFCKATNKIGTEYVKQAATFFGPDLHFDSEYTVSPPTAPRGNGRPSSNSFDQSKPEDYDDFYDHRRGFDR